ncbi:MAG TPA: biotin transporter BioY [Terracidiphilus sp.]|nr:biotin transporter BioY [Terracidiphilus sp.]
MSNQLSNSIASPIASSVALRSLRIGGIVLGGSLLLAVCAHLAIPLWFTPVPLTVQPFAVLLLGLLLSPRMAFATLAAYLAEGALGLPVFAPSPAISGFAHLFGPTGGYLVAYPFAAWLISFLRLRVRPNFIQGLAVAAAGDFLILLCGALWLAALSHLSLQSALSLGMLPFLPGDALKVAAAAGCAAGLRRFHRRRTNP